MNKTQSNQPYNVDRLKRLSKNEDYKELVRVIVDTQDEYRDALTVDTTSSEAALSDIKAKKFAYEALQSVMDLVEGAENGNINNPDGDNNYT